MKVYRDREGRFRVHLDPLSWHAIEGHCRKDFPRETGGILIGYYTADLSTAIVTDAVGPPDDSKKSPTRFERGTIGLAELLESLWHQRSGHRRYYLGEWHLHPNGTVLPSPTDDRQMESIARGSYRCPEPLLLTVGGTPFTSFTEGLWVYPDGFRIALSRSQT